MCGKTLRLGMLYAKYDPIDRADRAGTVVDEYKNVLETDRGSDVFARAQAAVDFYLEMQDDDTQYDNIRDLVGDMLHYARIQGDVEDVEEFVKASAKRFDDDVSDLEAIDASADDWPADARTHATNLITDLLFLVSREEEFESAEKFLFMPIMNFEDEISKDPDEEDDYDDEFDEEEDDPEFRM